MYPKYSETLNKNILSQMERLHISRADLARTFKVVPQSVSKDLSKKFGKNGPTLATIEAYADALKSEPWLLLKPVDPTDSLFDMLIIAWRSLDNEQRRAVLSLAEHHAHMPDKVAKTQGKGHKPGS